MSDQQQSIGAVVRDLASKSKPSQHQEYTNVSGYLCPRFAISHFQKTRTFPPSRRNYSSFQDMQTFVYSVQISNPYGVGCGSCLASLCHHPKGFRSQMTKHEILVSGSVALQFFWEIYLGRVESRRFHAMES